jgi:hypothetical protein
MGRLTTIPMGFGMSSDIGVRSRRWVKRAIIRTSSVWASAYPMHICDPRPNGIHAQSLSSSQPTTSLHGVGSNGSYKHD